MPGPNIGNFYGREIDMSSPESKNLFNAIAGADPRFIEMLGEYRTGKSMEPPRGNWDYTANTQRSEHEGAFLDWYINQMRKNVDSQRGFSGGDVQLPGPSSPGTVGESGDLLRNLLDQSG